MYRISEIEGVGEVYEKEFAEVGVFYIEDLLITNYSKLIQKLNIKNYRHLALNLNSFIVQAKFILLTKSGQFAEALYKSGLRGFSELAWMDTKKLKNRIEEAKNSHMIPESINYETAIYWQKKAIELFYTGYYSGYILDENRKGIAGAVILHEKKKVVTDANGQFFLSRIPFGKNKFKIIAENYFSLKINRDISHKSYQTENIQMIEGSDDKLYSIKKQVETFDVGDTISFVEIKSSDLVINDIYYVVFLYKNGEIKMNSVERIAVKNGIRLNKIRITKDLLNKTPKIGDFYKWDGIIFKKINGTLLKLRKK
jgi:hypothetical protein